MVHEIYDRVSSKYNAGGPVEPWVALQPYSEAEFQQTLSSVIFLTRSFNRYGTVEMGRAIGSP